jgi:hypothetical protein
MFWIKRAHIAYKIETFNNSKWWQTMIEICCWWKIFKSTKFKKTEKRKIFLHSCNNQFIQNCHFSFSMINVKELFQWNWNNLLIRITTKIHKNAK